MEYDLLCFRGYTATDTCVRIGAVLHVRAHWRPRHLRAHWRPPTCACALAPTYMLRAHWRPHGSCRSCLHVCVRIGAPHGSCRCCLHVCVRIGAPHQSLHMVPASRQSPCQSCTTTVLFSDVDVIICFSLNNNIVFIYK